MMIMKSVCPNTVFAVKIHKAVLLSYQAPLGCSPRVLTIRTLRQPNTVTPFINYYNNFSVRKKRRHELPKHIQPQPMVLT